MSKVTWKGGGRERGKMKTYFAGEQPITSLMLFQLAASLIKDKYLLNFTSLSVKNVIKISLASCIWTLKFD